MLKRPLTEAEVIAWPTMLRVAAMRFWLSRLEAWHGAIDDPERLAQQHDPEVFKRILLNRHINIREGLPSIPV